MSDPILGSGWRQITRRLLGAGWLIACLWVLGHTLLLRNADPKTFEDAENVMGFLMLALSFPSSLVIFWLPTGAIYRIHSGSPNDPRKIILFWLFLFVIGCFQWFLALPFIVDNTLRCYDYLVNRITPNLRRK